LAKSEDFKNKPLGDLLQAQLDGPGLSGAAFKELRRKHEITQEEVAERAEPGVTQALVSAIESGTRKFTEETGTALWNALHSIIFEKGEKQIAEARARALRLRGTPEGEAEAKKAGAWFEGFSAAGGTAGWLSAGEKEAMQAQINAQATIIEALKAQVKGLQEIKGWEQIEFLLKRMDAMEKSLAEAHRLIGIRSEAIAKTAEADELQEQHIKRLESQEKDSETGF
jgi:transcriptional regulator with XRE-family HTH domain